MNNAITHIDLIKKHRGLIEEARKTAGGRKITNVETDELEKILDEGIRAAAWAASVTLEMSALSCKVDALGKAVIDHPKFKGKTALVWRHEIDQLLLENTTARYPSRVPTLKEAERITRYFITMERVFSDPILCKRFDDVIEEFKRVDEARHHPKPSLLNIVKPETP